jgi:NAD(P)-dependent dehydrogenase (short-subunit alcohol dehydrogenase family)
MRFENKSVIITGGGGKIGKAYAIGFAKEGAKVALPDIASADHVVKAIRDRWHSHQHGLRRFQRAERERNDRRSRQTVRQRRRAGE